ncbi:MAG: MaoC/PaaZ C-terminal domain-containing protein [Paracoccus sp. (in: a-proteobacteria)]|uniref:MaoC family dehydratase n=1 Tax=Paracoccus sp. TaxID=267 RepID=UPI0039E31E1A
MHLSEITRHIDAGTVWAYAEITDDFNPIHVDPDFAAGTPMGRCIAHGMLSLNLIWQVAWPALNDVGRRAAELEIRFVKPVFVGDTITATGFLDPEASDSRTSVFSVQITNQKGETVIQGHLRAPTAGLEVEDTLKAAAFG